MRISWLDNAKAIAIILVVFGHTKGIGTLFKDLIYSFHIPLFFFLAGFLLKDKYLDGTFRSFTLKNIKSLVVPYASFWVIDYLYWLATHSMRSKVVQQSAEFPLFDPFIGLLFGIGETLHNDVLWFFTCLFCTTALFYWVLKVKDKRVISFILVFLGLLGPLIHHHINMRLPWNLELSFIAIVFYSLGYVVSKLEASRVVTISKSRFFAIVVLCGILLLIVKSNGRVNMNRMQFGNLVLFYLGAFSGIGVTILVSQIVPRNIFSEWLSTNTIVIFPLHLLIFSVFTGIGVMVFGLDHSFKENLMFSVFYTIGALAVCFPASYILSNYFPWIIGQRTTLFNKGFLWRKANTQSRIEIRGTNDCQVKGGQNE